MEVTVPSGRVYKIKQLNSLVIANLMKGFPVLTQVDTGQNGKPMVVTMDDIVSGAEYQKALIQRGVVEPVIDDAAYDEMDGPDADYLSGVIGRTSKITGPEVAEARAFRGELGAVPVG